jgi:hypothetical protein
MHQVVLKVLGVEDMEWILPKHVLFCTDTIVSLDQRVEIIEFNSSSHKEVQSIVSCVIICLDSTACQETYSSIECVDIYILGVDHQRVPTREPAD